MKRFSALFFCLFLIMNTASVMGAEPEVNAIAAVVADGATGRILWGRNETKPMAMASTTKIMTAIVAIENCDLKKKTTVSKNAAAAPPVKMHLREGETVTVEQLLYAMMLQSYNDAAVAVAEAVGGNTEGFCAMMNKKASEIGCRDTFFETPNGLDKGNHHSTAEDMAKIGVYALSNQRLMSIMNTREYNFGTNKTTYSFVNKDRLLTEYSGAVGMKTGFTGKAGHCFVGAAQRGDVALVSVVLASGWGAAGKSRKWTDTKALLDYGFENYKNYEIISGNESFSIPVEKARTKELKLEYAENVKLLLSEEEKQNIRIKRILPSTATAPVNYGDKMGTAKIYTGNVLLKEINIVSVENVEEFDFKSNMQRIIKAWQKAIAGNYTY